MNLKEDELETVLFIGAMALVVLGAAVSQTAHHPRDVAKHSRALAKAAMKEIADINKVKS